MRDSKKDNSKLQKSGKKAVSTIKKELRRVKSSLRTVRKSRDNWKFKCKAQKIELRSLKKELKSLGNKRVATKANLLGDTVKVKGHSYNANQIELCMSLRARANCSLQSCREVLLILSLILGLELIQPSRSTIRNWEMKLGLKSIKTRDTEAEEWAVILDESICIGRQKILACLGVKLTEEVFKKPLDLSSVVLLSMNISSSIKGEDVEKIIKGIESRNYKIAYAVSDSGNNLVKGLKMSQVVRVEDCTHALGKLLEKHFKEDELFQSFTKEATLFNQQINLSKDAGLMCPKQSKKARFLNLSKLSKWGVDILNWIDRYKSNTRQEHIYEKIKWVEDYRGLIEDMSCYQDIINQIFKVLKNEGLSEKSYKKCKKLLGRSRAPDRFKEEIKKYMNKNMLLNSKYENLICCSDIIESFFGRLKNKLTPNKSVGFTDGCLGMVINETQISRQQIKTSMEDIKLKDIANWKKENLAESMLQMKHKVFKNCA